MNHNTKTISSYDALPIKGFINAGVKVTINTDDMTVSNTTLKQEYKTLEKMGFTEADMQKFAGNSVDFAFCDKKLKDYLRSLI